MLSFLFICEEYKKYTAQKKKKKWIMPSRSLQLLELKMCTLKEKQSQYCLILGVRGMHASGMCGEDT